jgi:hypothetical protein
MSEVNIDEPNIDEPNIDEPNIDPAEAEARLDELGENIQQARREADEHGTLRAADDAKRSCCALASNRSNPSIPTTATARCSCAPRSDQRCRTEVSSHPFEATGPGGLQRTPGKRAKSVS